MATFVLVHGAWGGGWFWKKIIPLLRMAGHTVHATTATGMGDRVHLAGPAVDLDTHITDVANVLEFEDLTDVTLVGFSYGGMIITGVAERVPERLAGLVYFDALVSGRRRGQLRRRAVLRRCSRRRPGGGGRRWHAWLHARHALRGLARVADA